MCNLPQADSQFSIKNNKQNKTQNIKNQDRAHSLLLADIDINKDIITGYKQSTC